MLRQLETNSAWLVLLKSELWQRRPSGQLWLGTHEGPVSQDLVKRLFGGSFHTRACGDAAVLSPSVNGEGTVAAG